MIILNFCFKELIFGLYADSVEMVDFLHVLVSIEGGMISSPNLFKQMLGFFCCNYSFINSGCASPWCVWCAVEHVCR